MFGQGRPTIQGAGRARARAKTAACLAVVLLVATLHSAAVDVVGAAEPVTLRLRFAWGGGARRQWQGDIRIDQGSFSDLVPLGIEADEPGSMWIGSHGIAVRERSTRNYDAFDVEVRADPAATLTISLAAADAEAPAKSMTVPLSQLFSGIYNAPLDERNNRLLVRRTPGDRLRVRLERPSLIREPGETLNFGLLPQLEGVAPTTALRISVELMPARQTRALWSEDFDVVAPARGEPGLDVPVSIPLPQDEGVYDVSIRVAERSFRQRLVPVVAAKAIVERKIQLVVVAPERQPPSTSQSSTWQQVVEIDPANPGWWKRIVQFPQLKRIPLWPSGPLQHGNVAPWQHPLGMMVRLVPMANVAEPSWEAYPLPIDRPGTAHLLEIEYPSDAAQHLGISIVEPNAAGNVVPIGLDSGVYTPTSSGEQQPELRRHRLVFWPRTKTPLVLFTQRDGKPAVFGKMRVMSREGELPPSLAQGNERLVAAYLDRPLFAENFSAPGVLDTWSNQSVDDWETFYQGSRRLVEYLHHVGYNGLMISVLSDGSAIYPSRTLQPATRHDTGQLGSEGRDPLRKDVLELVFQLFDRDGLTLIPAIQFAAPLPELEALLRGDPTRASGIQWIGADGATWLERHPAPRGLAPYYNTLNPQVQQAMLAVVRELVGRYAGHRALAGVALQLSADGYAALPGPEWGMDDATVAQFERDLHLSVPGGTGPDRFARRAHFLLGEGREAWLRWRSVKLLDFYRRLHAEVAAAVPEGKLYLAAGELFENTQLRAAVRPALPQATRIEDALLLHGIDLAQIGQHPEVTLLRPRRIVPHGRLAARGVDVALNQQHSLDRRLGRGGCLLFHPPQRVRLASFDRQSPFGDGTTYSLLIGQSSPSGPLARRSLVRSLAAADVPAIFDGGWLLPMGREQSLSRALSIVRQLPAGGFQSHEDVGQPIVVRSRRGVNQTHVYLVNDSPWPAEVSVPLSVSPGLVVRELGLQPVTSRPEVTAGQFVWSVKLQPYDLAAIELSQGKVKVGPVDVRLEGEIQQQLKQRVDQLSNRAATLSDPTPVSLLTNGPFDMPPGWQGITGWSLIGDPDAEIALDRYEKRSGTASLKFTSKRNVASLQSNLFKAPETGRLAMSVWLRVETARHQPSVRLAIEGPQNGSVYYRFAQVGGQGINRVALGERWTQYIFQVDDVPLERIAQMRVRFDLMSAGTIWIEDVQLYDLKFNKNERIQLSKILVSARGALDRGELSDCQQLLEGYWLRFLDEFVAPVEAPIVSKPAPAAPPQPDPSEAEKPGMIDRLRAYVPQFMRF